MTNTMFFTSPVSNITPALASIAMSRSDSRDSTSSATYTSSQGHSSAYEALVMSASPAWPTTHRMLRTDSNASSTRSSSSSSSFASHGTPSVSRRGSTSTWLPTPYRSCLHATAEVPSSYLSDDDLLYIAPPNDLPIESIPNPRPKKELTTEEQIAIMREAQDKEDQQLSREQQQRRSKTVRFDVAESSRKSRRPSTGKRRYTYGKK